MLLVGAVLVLVTGSAALAQPGPRPGAGPGRRPAPPPPPRRPAAPAPAPAAAFSLQAVRSLDGSGNNVAHALWGEAGEDFLRTAPVGYADGVSGMASGPSARAISNLIFNDLGQNVFSENDISQWGWAWGQFVDHDLDLEDETPAESASIPFDAGDPFEQFTNDLGELDFFRTPAASGTGTSKTNPRQQADTISSYLDGSQVYGSTQSRLDWLTAADGYDLFLPGGYLPHASAKANAPAMDLMGALAGNPGDAIVAGDVRANENLGLTSIQTLFAREHNRIADSLPASLPAATRFQVARRVVGAEIQWITYEQFLPTLGVRLPAYRGYDPNVDATVSNEFATVGFRAHSMVHGEFEPTVATGTFSDAQLAAFAAAGMEIERNADSTVTIVVPLDLAFGNPDLLEQIGLGPILASLSEREYRNDEQIDNSLRSVLFRIPKPTTSDPGACNEPAPSAECFSDVSDLGADDVQRGRDHGMPTYNGLRAAYGLPVARSFTDVTGESTESLPAGMTCSDPRILAFTSLKDEDGNAVAVGNQDDAVSAVRASTLAARLKCLYGGVDRLDAFVGMVSEPHVRGTEFGPLQLAIWRKQFAATRDGDRFFYANDPELEQIYRTFGIDYRVTLNELMRLDAGVSIEGNVFKAS
ncbi:MAG TPA: peroxidase family protein [Gaiellaceae bacterium]|nr:peroxidase family protein [Gaiellaceae bacterium]